MNEEIKQDPVSLSEILADGGMSAVMYFRVAMDIASGQLVPGSTHLVRDFVPSGIRWSELCDAMVHLAADGWIRHVGTEPLFEVIGDPATTNRVVASSIADTVLPAPTPTKE